MPAASPSPAGCVLSRVPLAQVYLTLSSKSTAVFSNVPGPTCCLSLPRDLRQTHGRPAPPDGAPAGPGEDGGVRVVGCRFYAFGHTALYCGLLTYAGQVRARLKAYTRSPCLAPNPTARSCGRLTGSWAPPSAARALVLQAMFSCTTDPSAEPQPAELARLFADAVHELHSMAALVPRQLPRPPPPLGDRVLGAALWLAVPLVPALALAALARTWGALPFF